MGHEDRRDMHRRRGWWWGRDVCIRVGGELSIGHIAVTATEVGIVMLLSSG